MDPVSSEAVLAQTYVLWQIFWGDGSSEVFPCLEILAQFIAFVGCQYRHAYGAYQIHGISVIEGYPVGLLFPVESD